MLKGKARRWQTRLALSSPRGHGQKRREREGDGEGKTWNELSRLDPCAGDGEAEEGLKKAGFPSLPLI